MACRLILLLAFAATVPLAGIAAAQRAPPAKPEMTESCPGLVATRPAVTPASLQRTAGEDEIRVSYVGHATFLIESPQRVRIATDYNDYVRPTVLPDIVTMNHAHSTHYTDRPDSRIAHVLRGWGSSPDRPARHDVTLRDVRVRSVPTNIRSWIDG